MPPTIVYPWETRDPQDQAESRHNDPIRSKNRGLEAENLRLKQILLKNGIPWSPISHSYLAATSSLNSTRGRLARRTRSSVAAPDGGSKTKLPYLPTEVLLRVLHYALTSKEPIIDPLSAKTTQNMTVTEATRANELAIGLLATCKAFHAEGKHVLWSNNTFVFTHPAALRDFAELDFSFRRSITHINLRIIARYYDDEDRKHRLSSGYHPSLAKGMALKVSSRVKELNLSRAGFRSYTWNQVIDFLGALRAPFDPKHNKKLPRPRLLPGLETMRIDLVNFPDEFLPFSDTEFHDMTSHELGCTLNELQLTGLPCCDPGQKAGTDFSGMVKDDGLFLDGIPAFVQMKNALKRLEGTSFNARVIRAWRKPAKSAQEKIAAAKATQSTPGSSATAGGAQAPNTGNSAAVQESGTRHGHSHGSSPDLPAAPEEVGHPESSVYGSDSQLFSIWKRVPVLPDDESCMPGVRDDEPREWVEFDRGTGWPIDSLDDLFELEEGVFCCKCGEVHGSIFDPFDSDEF